MTFTIKKGRHRARPLYWLRWWSVLINPQLVARRVVFSFSSKYDLNPDRPAGSLDPSSPTYDPGDPQFDRNKLFGLSFGFNRKKNSARFGWRYDPVTNHFILSAYCYAGGNQVRKDLYSAAVANHPYDCYIIIARDRCIFKICRGGTVDQVALDDVVIRRSWLAFLMGLYFGGDRPAPHTMTVQLKKIKYGKKLHGPAVA